MKHRRRIHILVIISYLLYTLYEAHYDILRKGDFYRDLLIHPSADSKAIKKAARRLAASAHPDKNPNLGGLDADVAFIRIRTASDVLSDPVKRFAYERIGPDIVEFRNCTTVRDYAVIGSGRALPFYVSSGIFMLASSVLGIWDQGRFVRSPRVMGCNVVLYADFFPVAMANPHNPCNG